MVETSSSINNTGPVPYANRPWLKYYPAGVPDNVVIPPISLVDQFRDVVATYPDTIAAIFYGNELTYRELDERSSLFARHLIELGHQPGQPVLLLLPNTPQFMVAAYGILKAAGVIAALNPLLTEREIAELVDDSGARIVITLDRFWPKVEPLLRHNGVDQVVVTGVQDGLPKLKRWLYPLKYRKQMVKVAHDPERGQHQYRKLMSDSPPEQPPRAVASNHAAVFQYTGGTTGLPRAAVLTHRNLIANAQQVHSWVPDLKPGAERVMAILPFFHAYGGTLAMFLGMRLAATLIIVPRFELQDVMNLIEKYQPTVLPGVPTLFNALNGAVKNNPKRQQALKSINICVSGGAPLPPDVRDRFETITGAKLVEAYGLSEASPATHINPLDGNFRDGTIGLPIPSTEAQIVNPETRQPVPVGERGELAIKGPQIMQGYWRHPDDTTAVLSTDGWLYTGDVAVMDEDGYFSIVDRLKDIIITGGENIYPREIEDVLYEHPKIQEVAVTGVQHSAGGQIAKAFIVVVEGESLDRREVLQFCTTRLAKFKIPRAIEFRGELPKTPAGKILRRELQQQASDQDT